MKLMIKKEINTQIARNAVKEFGYGAWSPQKNILSLKFIEKKIAFIEKISEFPRLLEKSCLYWYK